MAEFQWWLLLVGLVAGGGLVAVVFLDGARREVDVDEAELPAEARWIAARLSRDRGLEARDIEAVLREHRDYKQLPPPDRLEPIDPLPADAAALAAARGAARTGNPGRADAPISPAQASSSDAGADTPT